MQAKQRFQVTFSDGTRIRFRAFDAEMARRIVTHHPILGGLEIREVVPCPCGNGRAN